MIALIVGASLTTATASEGTKPSLDNNKVTVTNIVKVSPFCIAIAKGEFDTVKKMIEYGESVNKSSNGKTPLMYAARYNRADIAELLIANGANLEIKDNNGNTAIDYAEMSKAKEVKKIIKNALKKK